ncbi:MAG TPA: hypothetical protein VGV14_10880, partial [Rhodanobacter sp.]|nr:hypothetical protein [Rhodanobacter sp.]
DNTTQAAQSNSGTSGARGTNSIISAVTFASHGSLTSTYQPGTCPKTLRGVQSGGANPTYNDGDPIKALDINGNAVANGGCIGAVGP